MSGNIPTSSAAQDTLKSQSAASFQTADVTWLSQYPAAKGSGKTYGSKDWLSTIILGQKTPAVSKPVAAVASGHNLLWILDQGNNTVFKVDMKHSRAPRFLKKKNIDLPSLVGMCAFTNNQMLITDSYLNKIFVVNPENKDCRVLNDSLILKQPTGIAYSASTNEIWVVETTAHHISILNEKGERIKTIGIRGSADGEFNYPTSICIDTLGDAYIVDAMNFRVQVLSKEGEIKSVFGSMGDGSGYFARPKGIATDTYGNIYVSDALFNVVQIFDIKGNFLYKFGAQGHDKGQFWMPSGIFIDKENNIFVADSYNSRVQVFQLTNVVKK